MLLASFIAYLALLIVLAKVMSRKMQGLSDFFLAGRTLPGVAIAITFVAAWFGAGSTIGTISEAYHKGISAIWLIAIPSFISCLVVTFFLAKKVRQLNSLSQPEAIERQYGALGSFLLSWVIMASITTFIASQLVAAGDLLEMTMHVSPELSVALILGAIIVYSVIGGFRAVVMTDIFQFFCFSVGILILFGYTLLTPGKLPVEMGLSKGFWDPLYNLPQNLAMLFTFVLAWSIAPEMWQRMSSTRSPEESQRAALTAGLILAGLYALVIATGILSIYHLPSGKGIVHQNVLIELAQSLPSPVLTAMVLVGVLSAITSTIDSSLNVGALTFARDIVNRYVWPSASQEQLLRLSQIATALIGIPAAIIALKYRNIIQVLWISADIYASTMFIPIMGLFYIPQCSRWAGILAMCCGGCPVVLNLLHDFHWVVLPAWWPAWPYTTILGITLSFMGFAMGMFIPRSEARLPEPQSQVAEEILAIEST
jgi:solute:Na+ symporter, SSS family